ncbi:Uncharacterised protein [Neisseria zoodegmatis]|uniref:DUF7832 domain-containing protein n=2 Tax=Neisseriaceae TaxID=481 RepID=A0A1X3CPN7_9NEIS|nr:hypothetical protein [Neisseria zoodegmatis]OSI09585.1 hypothetical protein BWD10_08955 [Neisseria zoodegmatis]SNU79354.1 Uncharacterised protein [Neisseria zoodegmatis]SUA44455.1 Uncharacterised protein [Neisseria zoodegmatis]
MHYDHITFHTEENYPSDLPEENAANHMGYYYKWAVSQDLHSPEAEALPQFAELQNGTLSGAEFILNQLGGGIDTTCFNDLGNRFTQYYYQDEDEGYGNFITDYFLALGLEKQEDFYRTEDTRENQQILNQVFQTAFDTWQQSISFNFNQNT